MLSFLWSSPTNNELSELVTSMEKILADIKAQSKYINDLSKKLMTFISKECPNYQRYFELITEQFTLLSAHYNTSSSDMERALEDLNDINHRYAVIKKYEEERKVAQTEFNEICKRVEATYRNLNPEKPDTIEKNTLAVRDRTIAAQTLLYHNNRLLKSRKSFKIFTSRRIKTAWTRYGEVLEKLYCQEAVTCNQIASAFQTISENISKPEEIFAKLNFDNCFSVDEAIKIIRAPISDFGNIEISKRIIQEAKMEAANTKEAAKMDIPVEKAEHKDSISHITNTPKLQTSQQKQIQQQGQVQQTSKKEENTKKQQIMDEAPKPQPKQTQEQKTEEKPKPQPRQTQEQIIEEKPKPEQKEHGGRPGSDEELSSPPSDSEEEAARPESPPPPDLPPDDDPEDRPKEEEKDAKAAEEVSKKEEEPKEEIKEEQPRPQYDLQQSNKKNRNNRNNGRRGKKKW